MRSMEKQPLRALDFDLHGDPPPRIASVPEPAKYICAPCSNCKAQLRELISYYELESRANIHYTGLVDLIVNAMADTPMRYLEPKEIRGEAVPEKVIF